MGEEGETDPWDNSEMTFIAGRWWTGQQIHWPLPMSLLMCFMEKSNPPGCNFCSPLIGALKWAPHSISLTAHGDPHLKQRPFTSKKGPKGANLPHHIVRKPPLLAPKEHVLGLSMVADTCFLQTFPWELKIYEGRWPQARRGSLYSHAKEPLTFSAEKLLPHTIRSSLAIAIMVLTSF